MGATTLGAEHPKRAATGPLTPEIPVINRIADRVQWPARHPQTEAMSHGALSGPQFGPHFMRTDELDNAFVTLDRGGDDGWSFDDLEHSMRTEGLKHPLGVAQASWDRQPKVFAGNHRFLVARDRLGWSHVPVEDESAIHEDATWHPVVPGDKAAKAYRERTPERHL